MMAFAYAPKNCDPPEIYVRWTWGKEMGVPWDRLGIDDEDLGHLAQLINMKQEADAVKERAKSKGHGGKARIGV